ncbi:hypothetical protein [Azospirillum argentinense]|uniref:hypothetical protein n=1 Tax=Azospirillum argentinense TaxID=2970906 RepID=UPI0010BF9BEF|nr:hypothetical protein [Azospirillum argentinense]
MRWRRGFWRLWVIISAAWVLLAGGMDLTDTLARPPFAGSYIYVRHEDAYRPYYSPEPDVETIRRLNNAPATGNSVPARIAIPDGPPVFLLDPRSTDDVRQIAAKFEAAKWSRIASALWPVTLFAFIPPAVLLVIGMAIAWVLRGFKPA